MPDNPPTATPTNPHADNLRQWADWIKATQDGSRLYLDGIDGIDIEAFAEAADELDRLEAALRPAEGQKTPEEIARTLCIGMSPEAIDIAFIPIAVALHAERTASAAREAAAREEGSEWQPIGTAPRGMIWAWQDGVQFAALWSVREGSWVARGYGTWAYRGNGALDKVQPTHWRPMPENPTGTAPRDPLATPIGGVAVTTEEAAASGSLGQP